jgi:PiT family inorganic phosphate transporter
MGGWRIIQTLGMRVSAIETPQGFAAGTSTATVILTSSHLGFPLSTTHVATGSIFGAGAARGAGTVHWSIGGQVAFAWLLTLPATAAFGAVAAWIATTGPLGTIIVAPRAARRRGRHLPPRPAVTPSPPTTSTTYPRSRRRST